MTALSPFDRKLLGAIEDGLPVCARPYAQVAEWLGVAEDVVIARLRALVEAGVIRRFGFVVHHRELGFCANAMVVWDIPDGCVDEAARIISDAPYVTLCYRRPRRGRKWPYNLFCMIHGTSREVVLEQVARLEAQLSKTLGLEDIPHAPLFSKRRFKQCGARFSTTAKEGAA